LLNQRSRHRCWCPSATGCIGSAGPPMRLFPSIGSKFILDIVQRRNENCRSERADAFEGRPGFEIGSPGIWHRTLRGLRNREPMNGASPRERSRSIDDLSKEVCELFGQQFDALQQGMVEVELEQYLERRSRIHQLQTELKAKFLDLRREKRFYPMWVVS